MITTGKDIWSVKVSLNKTEFMVWTKGYVNCHSALMKTKGPQAPSEGRHLDSVTAVCVTASRHKLKEIYLLFGALAQGFKILYLGLRVCISTSTHCLCLGDSSKHFEAAGGCISPLFSLQKITRCCFVSRMVKGHYCPCVTKQLCLHFWSEEWRNMLIHSSLTMNVSPFTLVLVKC